MGGMNTQANSVARRKQPAITIRSSRAAERLALLTRGGRSQADVIEEALDRMPVPTEKSREEIWAEIEQILASVPKRKYPTMAELDDDFWDEDGLPR